MKTIILIVVCLIIANCDIKTQETIAKQRTIILDKEAGTSLDYTDYIIDGVRYRVFTNFYQGSIGLSVLNLTKDSLEIELIKQTLIK